jgi:hypothetical protein
MPLPENLNLETQKMIMGPKIIPEKSIRKVIIPDNFPGKKKMLITAPMMPEVKMVISAVVIRTARYLL